MAVVAVDTRETLSAVSKGDVTVLGEVLGLRWAQPETSGLDGRTFALVGTAALIALDAPQASYAYQVANALRQDASPEDILDVVRAVAPVVGEPRVVAAAQKILAALGLWLPDGQDG